MALRHRIENLECKEMRSQKHIVVILPIYDETVDEAKQRYCAENGITVEELDNSASIIGIVKLVKTEDVKGSLNSIENSR